MDGDLTWGGEHTVECTDDMLWNSAPETCKILLTSVTPINSIKRGKTIKGGRSVRLGEELGIF